MALLLLLMSVTACETEPDEPRGKLTQRGKLVYDEWNRFMTTNVMNDWLDMALRFNAYYEADEARKIAVEDSLLTQYKIRQNGNRWELRIDNRVKYSFTLDQALSKSGAHWECVRVATTIADAATNYGFTDRDVHYTIDCVATNCWRIEQTADTLLPISVVMEMTKLPPTIANRAYNLLGEGQFRLPESTYGSACFVHFSTLYPLEHTIRQWGNGVLQLQAYNLQSDTIPVKVVFEQSSDNYYTYSVTYRGVTETYNH
ncbi:MAG: hypothetical protein ACI392_06900 [Paludibacteraceae bacterium]